MADNNKVDIHFDAQTRKASGEVKEFRAEIEKIGPTGKRTAAALTGSFKTVESAIGRVRKVISTISFGTMFLESLTNLIGKLTGKTKEAEEQARKLAEQNQKAADATRVEKLAEAYDKLAKSISGAATARQRANELEDMETASARDLEDVNAQAAKDAELAALDPNDRYYEQRKAQIEAKYSGQAANRAAARKAEDAERTAARTAAEAEAKGSEAAQRRGALVSDRQELEILKSRAAAARKESQSINDKDATGFFKRFIENIKRVAGGDIEKFNQIETDEGDEERARQKQKADDLEAKIKAKEKDIAEKERKIAELEEEAQYLSRKSVIQGSMAENAKDAASVTRAAGQRGEATAAAGLSGQIESERDAARAKALLEAEKARIEQQIAAQSQRKADAGAAVFNAQGALSEAKANGNRSGATTAAQQLAAAQTAAQNIELSADQLINRLTERLKSVESLLNKANSAISKNNSQRLTAQAEALTTN